VRVPALVPESNTVTGGEARPGPRLRSRVNLAIGVGATGVAGLLVSGALGLVALSKDNSGDYEARDRYADIATGFGIGGGVLVAAGIIVYLTAPRTPVTVAPTASASTVGISVLGRF
jgi:hypothetical protein